MIGIGSAVAVVAVVAVFAVGLTGSSGVTAPTVDSWGPSNLTQSQGSGINGVVAWSLVPGGQGGDRYQVKYDGSVVATYVDGQVSQRSSGCSPNTSNTGVSCTISLNVNVQAPDPITVIRTRGGASASASANWSK